MNQTELEKKSQEHKILALQNEYDRLLQKYERLSEETAELSNRLAQCNMESRKLTSDTVRYIGGINILHSDRRSNADAALKK